MLDFLNEVLMIEDLEPDAYQMGISGKSGAKMKAPDGGKASMKGDFNALHPRYPKGHPQGGKFMPKGSKDQINAVAKAKGVSTEQAAAMVGGKAPANKGKLSKFSGSAGAVGKAQKVLKDKNSTPEQRAKAKASIAKAAGKMRGDAPMADDKPKRGKISNKETPAKKGKLSKFSGSAGAVGKAQKVLKDKNSTPEQRAKAKASIQKAAMKMRGEAPVVAEKPKRGKISNKEIMARNAGTSAPVVAGSMTKDVKEPVANKMNDPKYRGGQAGTSLNTRKQILNNIAESKQARESSVSQNEKRVTGLGIALTTKESSLMKINEKRQRKGLPPLSLSASATTKPTSNASKRVKRNLATSKSARTEKLSESQRQRMAEKANKKRMSKGSKPKKESFKISKEDEDFLNSL